MAFAETAQLAVKLTLQDQLTGGLAKSQAELAAFNKQAQMSGAHLTKASGALNSASAAASRFGGAMGKAKSSLASFLTGPLGVIGLGAGIFGVTKFLTGSINKAEEFTKASADLASVLKITTGEASALVDTMDDFGIAADKQVAVFGRVTKNLDALVGTTKQAKAFTKEYGFSLTDTKGKILTGLPLLEKMAGFWKSNATQNEKAALMAKVFGKQWTTLIPLLNLGAAGLKKYADEQIHLTAAQAKTAAQFRIAQRDFASAFDEMQTRIGLSILPELTPILKNLTKALSDNQGEILGFIHGAVNAAKEIGGAIATYVVPAVKAIAGAWNSIPPDLRKLLITGFIGNKILKMTIGFDPLDIFRKGLGSALGGMLGRGSSPMNPVYVSGGIGGGGPNIGPAGGWSLASLLAAAGGGLAIAAGFKILIQDPAFDAATRKIVSDAQKQIASKPGAKTLNDALGAVQGGIRDIRALPGGDILYAGQLKAFEDLQKLYRAAIAEITGGTPATTKEKERTQTSETRSRQAERFQKELPEIKRKIEEGNRQSPNRRDLQQFSLSSAIKIQQGWDFIASVERAGFAAVVAAVGLIQPGVDRSGLPAILPPSTHHKPGKLTPRVGIEKGRYPTMVQVKVSPSGRQNQSAQAATTAYGPTPVSAGAAVVLVG